MYRTHSTKNVPFILFLVSIMNSVFGLYYGLLVSNSTFVLINVVGVLLWGFYILTYIGVSRSKSGPLTQVLMLTMMLCGHVIYLRLFAPHPPALTNTLGLFLFVWSVLLILTPVLDIIHIVQQGSSAGSDVPLMVGGSLCCGAWLAYGYLLKDVFIYGPNVLGLGVNSLKLATMVAYSGSPAKPKSQ
ncbi:sugar transporter SWEET1-like isoform X2 [Littorina saxatilis]